MSKSNLKGLKNVGELFVFQEQKEENFNKIVNLRWNRFRYLSIYCNNVSIIDRLKSI